MSDIDHDLIIVGGGMAGASLALALAGHGLRIMLIESAVPEVNSVPNYDDRAIALAYGSSRILESLGVWSQIAKTAEPIKKIHVSEKGGFGFTHLDHAQEGVPALGYVVTARDLGVGLLGALKQCQDVEVLAPATVTRLEQYQDRVVLTVEAEGKVSAVTSKLLAAADGGNSFIRGQLDLPVHSWQYGQNAVIANLTPAKPHRNIAYERFTANGPVALLPMTEQRCALVWTVEDDSLDQVLSYNDGAFLDQVQQRFGWRLGRFQHVGKRTAYPLVHIRALKSTAGRVALVGNAAHSLHPVAGQGFNLGIRDVAVLAEVVMEAFNKGSDVGAATVLDAYENWRKNDQRGVAVATDTLVRLFTNPLKAAKLGRNLGMLALDALPAVRHELARSAMGLHGRQPRLARGLSLE